MTPDDLKRQAAAQAVTLVESGMRLGLGTGSTAAHFVRLLGERIVRDGLDIRAVATSEATERLARDCGVPLTTLNEMPELDLTIDGADEIGPELALIKGGGGALLREKIVAHASRRFVVIADVGKVVETLGRFPLPVEVTPFGHRATGLAMAHIFDRFGLAADIRLRAGASDAAFVTDNGNLIYDCALGAIPEPGKLALALAAQPGVVEHGLFVDMCAAAIIADPEGVAVIEAPRQRR